MTGVETGSLHEEIVLPLKIQVDLLMSLGEYRGNLKNCWVTLFFA